jgi:hypothetical protein
MNRYLTMGNSNVKKVMLRDGLQWWGVNEESKGG